MVTSPFVSNLGHSLHLNTRMPNGDFVIISYFNYLKYTGHPTIFFVSNNHHPSLPTGYYLIAIIYRG